jgi:hypothetical protein
MKTEILEALARFVAQRSGIDGRNYGGSREAFMQDYRRILRDGREARALLRAVELSKGLPESILVDVLKSGRLTWDGKRLEYCAGQYFPTEYRAAACRALASALWNYWRDGGRYTADQIREAARMNLGRGIASRWFN